MIKHWTPSELRAWAGHDAIACLDAQADRMRVPEWLGISATSARDQSAGQRLAAAHPEDRRKLVDLWWEAIGHPAETYELDVRVEGERGWSRERMRYLNLLDQLDVAAVVVAVRYLGAAQGVDLPDVIQSGEYEAVDLLIHELDEGGVILRTEGRVEEISGRPPDQVVGQSVLDHLHPDGFEDAIRMWMEVMAGPAGTTRTGRQRVLRPDGTTIWVETTTIKRVAADGTVTATVICHDLTQRRKQEAALKTSQQEFQLLADQVPGAVFRADHNQRLTFCNEQWTDLLGDEPAGRFLYEIVYADDRGRFDEQMNALASGTGPSSACVEVRDASGERTYAISCRSVLDLVNDRRSYVGAVTDVTSTVTLRERAEQDPLTGLLNRLAIEERLAAAMADHPNRTVVVFVDLDGFKDVNDTHGHHAGDQVLVAIAHRLRGCVRADDLVGRYGGDEFVLVLHDWDIDDESIGTRSRQD